MASRGIKIDMIKKLKDGLEAVWVISALLLSIFCHLLRPFCLYILY